MRVHVRSRSLSLCAAVLIAVPTGSAGAQQHVHARAATVLTAAYMSLLAYGDRDDPGTYAECWDGRDQVVLQNLIRQYFDVYDVKWTRIMRQKDDNVQAFIFAADKRVVVAFRGSCGKDDERTGSNNSANWRMNYNGLPTRGAAPGFEGVVSHPGWARALDRGVSSSKTFYDDLADWVRQALSDAAADNLLITGHSMGGAMAQYFTYRFLQDGHTTVPRPLEGYGDRYVQTQVITFGAPHAGFKDDCGSRNSLPDAFTEQNGRKGVYAHLIQAGGDDTPRSTAWQYGAVESCPLPLGNIENFQGFRSDAHNLRNFIRFAHDNYFVPSWVTPIATDPGASPLTSVIAGRKIPFAAINIGWVSIAGRASAVGWNVEGNAMWAVSTELAPGDGGKKLFRGDPAGWAAYSGAAVRIAGLATPGSGVAIAVNAKNEIYSGGISNGIDWTKLPGSGTDVAVGPGNAKYVVGTDGSVMLLNSSSSAWDPVGNLKGARRIAAGDGKTVWALDVSGKVQRFDGTTWQEVPFPPGFPIAIAAGPQGVCVIGGATNAAGDRSVYCKTVSGWDPTYGAGVEIAMGPSGRLLLANRAGALFLSR